MLRIFSLSVVLILFSCSSNDDDSIPPGSETTLLGNGWLMTSYTLNGQSEREALDNGSFSFILQNDSSQTSGFVECNAFGGTYALDGNLLSFINVAEDGADCTEDSEQYREQNNLVRAALIEQLNTLVSKDGLTISMSNGDVMFFELFPEVFNSMP